MMRAEQCGASGETGANPLKSLCGAICGASGAMGAKSLILLMRSNAEQAERSNPQTPYARTRARKAARFAEGKA